MKTLHSLIKLAAVLLLFCAGDIHAAGEVDASFNASAYGDINFNGNVYIIRVLPDGKTLIGGQFTEVQGYGANGLARLNADGSVDTTFNGPDFYNNLGIGWSVYAVAVLPDGKILVGGDFRGVNGDEKGGIRRLNPNGSLDSTFFVEILNGDANVSQTVHDIEIAPDGKIVIGGEFRFAADGTVRDIGRLNADGTRDTSFATTITSTTIKGVEIQADGKIVAGGHIGLTPYTFRFNTNGSMDSSFASIQSGNGPIEAVELQPDGKVIVSGNYTLLNGFIQGRVSRINTDGSLDLNFNLNSVGANGVVNDLAIRPDGKIIIAGGFSTYNSISMQRLARLNTDGSLDNTFVNIGTITNTVVNDVELLPDNGILAGLASSNLVNSLLKFGADGSFDASFVVRATRIGLVRRVLQQPDGKVLVGGTFLYGNNAVRRSLARFTSTGALDESFVPAFNNVNPLPNINSFALQADGKILVTATNGFVLTRLNSDGSTDGTFASPFSNSSDARDVVVQADGKIIVVGALSGGAKIVRLNTNGSIDGTFSVIQPDMLVHRVRIQPDGKILIGGDFTMFGASTIRSRIARLNTDGSLDASFNPPGGANSTVYSLDLQPDGKIVLGGAFTALNGNPNMIRVGRLNADGTLDTSLVQSTNAAVLGLRVQADGKIVIGGSFSAIAGGVPRNGIARLNSDGTLDTGFTTFSNKTVWDVQLQSDGKILIGGEFNKIDGTPRVRVARLLNAAVPSSVLFDYDGDAKADISVFRPSENKWYIFRSSDMAVTQTTFAIAGDVPVPADYDGDLKTDIAIYRPSSGAWWYLSSQNGAQINANWGGEAGDIPRPSDFNGDGKTDFIIFRPTNSTWYRITSTGTVSNVAFGLSGDKPVIGDFDGDGKSDVAIFRPSTGDWWYQSSINNAQLAVRWGISTDTPAPADFDGDGKTDFAVFRPSTGVWYVINSSNGSFLIGPFGISEDKPVPADYDGDGKAELAVFRPSTGIWYQLRTNSGFFAMQFGVSTDIPTPNAFVP